MLRLDSVLLLRSTPSPTRAVTSGLGGFSVSVGNSTGNSLPEGHRVAPHVMLFGTRSLAIQVTCSRRSTPPPRRSRRTRAWQVTGTGSVPATYGSVGMRTRCRLGAICPLHVPGGVDARLHPTTSSVIRQAHAPMDRHRWGTDVTAAVATAGLYTRRRRTAAWHDNWRRSPGTRCAALDRGRRLSLRAYRGRQPARCRAGNTNGMTFGFGYRF